MVCECILQAVRVPFVTRTPERKIWPSVGNDDIEGDGNLVHARSNSSRFPKPPTRMPALLR